MPMSRVGVVFALLSVVFPASVFGINTNPFFKENANAGEMVGFAVSGGSPGSAGVAFVGNAASGGFAGLYVKPGAGGALITLTGLNFRPTPVGLIGFDGSSVVFRGIENGNAANTGLFSAPLSGNVPITIVGTSFGEASYAPSVSPNGNIAFKDLESDGATTGLFAQSRDGGIKLTLSGAGFSQIGRPAVSDLLDVAFVASPAGATRPSVYVQPSNLNIPVSLKIPPTLTVSGDQVSIEPNAQDASLGASIAFTAIDESTGQLGLYHSDHFTPQGINSAPKLILAGDAANPLGNIFSSNSSAEYLSKKGYDYYKSRSDLNSPGLLPGEEIRLIGLGDAVDGSTVTDIQMSETSLLDSGDAILYLTLADGTRGFYIASVPEPGVATAMLLAATAMIARRRR